MGKAAFPRVHLSEDFNNGVVGQSGADGMSLREYAAIQAMQGLLAGKHFGCAERANVAYHATQHADALLARLEQTEDGNAQVD